MPTITFIYPLENQGKKNILIKLLRRLFLPIPAVFLLLKSLTSEKYKIVICDERKRKLKIDKTDLVALTAFTYNVNRAYEISKEYKKLGSKVILGGIHASTLPFEALEHVDIVVIGQAEHVWEQLLKDFENNNLKNLYYGSPANNYGEILFKNIGKIKPKDLSQNIQTTRGCINKCSFCSVHIFNDQLSFEPIEIICALIKKASKGIIKHRINFLDDNIFANPKYAVSLFKALIPLKIKWSALSSINIAQNLDVLDLAKASGCRSLAIGFESLDQETLFALNKPYNASKYYELINRIHKRKIQIKGFFILGSDTEDATSFSKILEFCKNSLIANPHFLISTPLPGTKLMEEIAAENRIINSNWDFYNCGNLVFQPKKMTNDELLSGFKYLDSKVNSLNFLIYSLYKNVLNKNFMNLYPIIRRIFRH